MLCFKCSLFISCYRIVLVRRIYSQLGINCHDDEFLCRGISGLVVKSIVAIDGPRVRFTADAFFCNCFLTNTFL
ncbi:hypothetical protein F4808DRAFT_60937 [Astrocystis sublimbata]|nr:hypothetical protein F4808DRAFT_60937 [Astrocystis sublimbata]